jgi:quinol-cytochrome oxidoreductase complex cytochrome b subunit
MMATAFIGYVLPWGQMSFWGATVITNLFSAVPKVGSSIVEWLWGGFSVDNATLNRFYSFHYLLPFLIAGVILGHIALLHESGSNNPLGVQKNVDVIKFHGAFFVKDLFGAYALATVLLLFLTFLPNILGHTDNYLPANPLVTPTHIVPEWYFLPFYAILRSVPDKLGGVFIMISSIALLALLPFDAPPLVRVRRDIFRLLYAIAFWAFIGDFLLLGWLGQLPIETPYPLVSLLAVLFYFAYFLIIVPGLEYAETWYDLKNSEPFDEY